jgi:hypothetical protein
MFPNDPTIVELKKWSDKDGCKNPDHSMFPDKPPVKQKKDCPTPAEWSAYNLAKKEYNDEVVRIKGTEKYISQKAGHTSLVNAQKTVAASFFWNIPTKKGWVFDCSVSTDGVSLSLQYSKKVQVPVDALKKTRSRNTREDKVAEDYDRDLETSVPEMDLVVLGVDPGRSNMATATYQVNGKSKTWKLTRGAFYDKSGIKKRKRKREIRFADMTPKWASLCGEGVALSTSKTSELVAYLTKYIAFCDEWWKLALMRRESRDNLQKYIGKRKVLDSFWASIKRKMEKTHPTLKTRVAYGSAITAMKATGPGEAAVPTGAMFASCKRIFKDNVSVTDEFRTTMVAWETGTRKEMVYKVPRLALNESGQIVFNCDRLHHTSLKTPPEVSDADELAVQVYNSLKKAQDKHRKGGFAPAFVPEVKKDKLTGQKIKERYPEVRGLRFLPESGMFVDRDRSAALTIARLLCMELKGLGRPLPFHRSFAL